MRAFRALATMLACAGLAFSPGVASAVAKKRHGSSLREAKNTRPKTIAKRQDASSSTGLGNRLGLPASTQLAAMNTALKAAPSFFAGRSTGCAAVVPMLASLAGPTMAGNFRDAAGACYVWLNVRQSSMLTGSEICKTTLHEYGHLTGLEHSVDANDVMFAPFKSDPIPTPCQPQAPRA
jgi:hypothetical protein